MHALAVLLGKTPRREAVSGLVGVGRACGLLGDVLAFMLVCTTVLALAAACVFVSSSSVRQPLTESCLVPWYQ